MSDGPLSPCILVCTMNRANGLCLGCFRTMAEIADWSRANDNEKRAILARVEVRRTAA
ncbi:DUF1289 domain-containing protein [Sphingomonas sp. Mn802worker]|uniref:DUF1289 domain-containing protein n=1 Tax=Sphingomonas sp. Mn802worker TaxID=629773 RepID=UPI0003AA0E53|nr:DUF1289 domain-containing protein [Sphingomonas sp. Mn802worker]